jgi:hypothetical protein
MRADGRVLRACLAVNRRHHLTANKHTGQQHGIDHGERDYYSLHACCTSTGDSAARPNKFNNNAHILRLVLGQSADDTTLWRRTTRKAADHTPLIDR